MFDDAHDGEKQLLRAGPSVEPRLGLLLDREGGKERIKKWEEWSGAREKERRKQSAKPIREVARAGKGRSPRLDPLVSHPTSSFVARLTNVP